MNVSYKNLFLILFLGSFFTILEPSFGEGDEDSDGAFGDFSLPEVAKKLGENERKTDLDSGRPPASTPPNEGEGAVSGDPETHTGDSAAEALKKDREASLKQGLPPQTAEEAGYSDMMASQTDRVLQANRTIEELKVAGKEIQQGREMVQSNFTPSELDALALISSQIDQQKQIVRDNSPPEELDSVDKVVNTPFAQDLLSAGNNALKVMHSIRGNSTAGGAPLNLLYKANNDYVARRLDFYRFAAENKVPHDIATQALAVISQLSSNPNAQTEISREVGDAYSGSSYTLAKTDGQRAPASVPGSNPSAPQNNDLVANGKPQLIPQDLLSFLPNQKEEANKVQRLTDDRGVELSQSQSESTANSASIGQSNANSSVNVEIHNKTIADSAFAKIVENIGTHEEKEKLKGVGTFRPVGTGMVSLHNTEKGNKSGQPNRKRASRHSTQGKSVMDSELGSTPSSAATQMEQTLSNISQREVASILTEGSSPTAASPSGEDALFGGATKKVGRILELDLRHTSANQVLTLLATIISMVLIIGYAVFLTRRRFTLKARLIKIEEEQKRKDAIREELKRQKMEENLNAVILEHQTKNSKSRNVN